MSTAAVGLGLAVFTAPPSQAAQAGAPAAAGPEALPCRAIGFQSATVTPLASTGAAAGATAAPGAPERRYRLTVSGQKPATNVQVSLVPAVYVRQPAFWAITVTGCESGIGLPVLTPYTATYDFTGPLGRCGIDVIGATSQRRFDLAGCGRVPLPGTQWVLDPASLDVPVPADSPITASFSATTLSGSTSCNAYQAAYTAAPDGGFSLGAISTTLRPCNVERGMAEAAFLKRLRVAAAWWASGSELVLLDAAAAPLLRFTPAAPAIPAAPATPAAPGS